MTFGETLWEIVLPVLGMLFLIFLTIGIGNHLYNLLQLAAKCS